MQQDHANEPTTEDPQTSAELPLHLGESPETPKQETTIEPITEEAEELADNTAEEDADDELEEEPAESESATPPSSEPDSQNTATSSAPSTSPESDSDERSGIEKQPYDFDHCTVQIAIQLLPDDQGHLGGGDANGRKVVIGVRSHLDAPILRVVRLNELGALPPIVNELLDALKAELPAREQGAREAFEKKKEEKAKRKATVTASKTSRGKKSKATSLSTAPGSDATVTDNRPRPEITITTSPKQQMGLF